MSILSRITCTFSNKQQVLFSKKTIAEGSVYQLPIYSANSILFSTLIIEDIVTSIAQACSVPLYAPIKCFPPTPCTPTLDIGAQGWEFGTLSHAICMHSEFYPRKYFVL